MSEPIVLWEVETGKQIVLASPSEARRLMAAGVLTDSPPAVAEPSPPSPDIPHSVSPSAATARRRKG